MLKSILLCSVASSRPSSFCGCGDCSLQWLPGSKEQEVALTAMTCSQWHELLSLSSNPLVGLKTGKPCIDVTNEIRASKILNVQGSTIIGPRSTCPDGLNVQMTFEEASDKIKIDLYYESQCPGCKQMITTSFADAMKADGFLEMAEVNFWPYGNAQETKTDMGYSFTCQHGEAECQYNMLETCGKSIADTPVQYFNFLNCVETHDTSTDFKWVARTCGTQAALRDQQLTDIMGCYDSNMGWVLEHDVAEQTESLNPPHKWVPWVTVDDVYDENVQDEIGDSLLKYVCDNYTGENKSKDCPDSETVFAKASKDVCINRENTAFLQ